MEDLYECRLGSGVVEVLTLDDSEVRKLYQVAYRADGPRHIVLQGRPERLHDLLQDLDYRWQMPDAWDQPAWYARSAKCAAARLRRALNVGR